MTRPTLTIARAGVRIWLQSATEEVEAADTLVRMFQRRKFGTVESDALWAGACALRSEAMRSICELQQRGGLLHFGAARVDYSEGAYLVPGVAAELLEPVQR